MEICSQGRWKIPKRIHLGSGTLTEPLVRRVAEVSRGPDISVWRVHTWKMIWLETQQLSAETGLQESAQMCLGKIPESLPAPPHHYQRALYQGSVVPSIAQESPVCPQEPSRHGSPPDVHTPGPCWPSCSVITKGQSQCLRRGKLSQLTDMSSSFGPQFPCLSKEANAPTPATTRTGATGLASDGCCHPRWVPHPSVLATG